MEFTRTFSTKGVHPYDEVTWEQRDVVQENRVTGEVIFEQRGVEFPDFWSMNAATIVTTTYFRGALGTDEREYSLRQLIDRVVKTYRKAGEDGGYFSAKDGQVFEEELTWLLLHQYFSFNSPVWFNVGTTSVPQVSACQPYDALVTTEHGLRKIGDLHIENAVGTSVATASGDALILATKNNGRKEVLRITTASGHDVDVTADHLVWVMSKGFIPAGEVQIGDQMTWHRQQAKVPALVGARGLTQPQAEAALAGWLATDGFVGQYDHGTNRSLTIEPHTINDDEYAWIDQSLDLVFPGVHFNESTVDTVDPKVDFRRRRAYGEQFRPFVESWELLSRGVTAAVPERLFTANLDVVAAWLKSVFQADGYVSLRDTTAQIGISTEAEAFIKGTQALLSRFGIFSRVSNYEDARGDRNTRWVLSIMNHGDRELFARHIGFVSDDKQSKLLESLDIDGLAAKDTKKMQVKSIVSRGIMEVYDIQTTEGEYLTSGGLRVHNCFILNVEDSMESILNWYREEGMIFKGGSGAGVNLSNIRSSKELLSSGGSASGPVSFMRGADASAGTIKSGGACLAPWTMVYTAEHGPMAVETLAQSGEQFTAISYNPLLGRMQATRGTAFLSGRKQLVRLTTDKGVFTMSADHPVMLMSGGYKPVGELTPGMSIRPGCVTVNGRGVQRVGLQDGAKSKLEVHRLVAMDIMGADIDGFEVHHKDKNPANNAVSNLEVMTRHDHISGHMNEALDDGTHPFLKFHGLGNHPQVAGDANGMSTASGNRTEEYRANQVAAMHRNDVYRLGQDAAARQRMLNKAYEVVNNSGSIETFEDYCEGRRQIAKLGYSKAQILDSIESRFGSYDEFVAEVRANNHRVVSVEALDFSDVYDVEIISDTPEDRSEADGHNFMIISETHEESSYTGIMVHNTRRAAKMVVLDIDHPDIEEFIETKAREEDKIRALRDAGFDMEISGKDINSVQYQNANNSVRVDDLFMEAVRDGKSYGLVKRSALDKDGKVREDLTDAEAFTEVVDARQLFRKVAQAAWECADPGVQYKDTINDWHTLPAHSPIMASNPCFTGDTLVAVADGRNAVRIDQLAAEGKPVDVYSKDTGGRTVIRTMKDIRMTRRNTEILLVTLDDETSVRCTPDHLFMLRDGSYVAAKDLVPGASLKRFDSEVAVYGGSANGSQRRRVTGVRGWNWQHHLIAERKVGDYRDGRNSFHLDHMDDDSLNDSPDNLQVLTIEEHAAKTAAANMIGDANPARRLMSDQWRSNIARAMSGSGNPRFIEVDPGLLQEVYDRGVLSDARSGSRQGWVAWNEYVCSNGLKGQVPMARSDRNRGARIQGMSWDDFIKQFEFTTVNHKVVSVVPAGFADVFDGEVEETHNFAIITTSVSDARLDTMSGVFVHNCSEFMSIDNSSCNLASINLMKFLKDDGTFDIDTFEKLVKFVITAMDISICFADFPTEAIGETTRNYRQLGIGYANLGALLMATGHAYDSDSGRALAAAITSLMSAAAHVQSSRLAEVVGPYHDWKLHAPAHERVVGMHRDAATSVAPLTGPDMADANTISSRAYDLWTTALSMTHAKGLRNSQLSLLAPTGTIGFLMDCDTTGIEPDFSLVKFKKLVGGGSMQIVNNTVSLALERLGYSTDDSSAITAYIKKHGHVVDAPGLKPEHYAVFDCAVGDRSISAMGHIKMMAAVQPFLSGAISKTVNLPENATVEDIEQVYYRGWELGLKAIAVYRDNCKVGQPLSSAKTEKAIEPAVHTVNKDASVGPQRNRLPRTRQSRTTSFSVGGADGYITSGEYDTGELGELFLKLGKQGSTLAGMMDAFSIAISIGLQYGVPLESFVRKFTNMKFEPAGITNDPDLRMAQSIIDYVFQRLALDYMSYEERSELGVYTAPERARQVETGSYTEEPPKQAVASAKIVISPNMDIAHDAPLCMTCGTKMRPSGSCHVCEGCGSTSGCS